MCYAYIYIYMCVYSFRTGGPFSPIFYMYKEKFFSFAVYGFSYAVFSFQNNRQFTEQFSIMVEWCLYSWHSYEMAFLCAWRILKYVVIQLQATLVKRTDLRWHRIAYRWCSSYYICFWMRLKHFPKSEVEWVLTQQKTNHVAVVRKKQWTSLVHIVTVYCIILVSFVLRAGNHTTNSFYSLNRSIFHHFKFVFIEILF